MEGRDNMYSKFKQIISVMIMLALIVTFFEVPPLAYAATLDDGTYTIDYVIKKPEDESVSMANDYWEKPATVIVSGGAITMQMTINYSEWVTIFKVPSGNSYVDTKIISRDSEENTRLIQFSLDSLNKPMLSQIHVTVPEIDYDHDYTIRFVYHVDTLKLISQPESTSTPNPSASANTNSKEAETSTVKQTESDKESSQPNKNTASQSKGSSPASTAAPDSGKTAATSNSKTKPENSASSSNKKGAEDSSSLTVNEAVAEEAEQQPTNLQADKETNVQAGDEAQAELSSIDANEDADVTRDDNVTDDQETVEMTAALDGATVDESATVVASSVVEDSGKKKGVIMITFLGILLVIGTVTVVMYRRLKAKKS